MLQEIRCLLDQFKEFYEKKLSEVEENNTTLTNEEILGVKLGILETYVTDLAEQNLNLIETSAILQTETEARVNILQKLLDKTSENSQEYVRAINKYQKLIPRPEELQTQWKIKDLEAENLRIQQHNVDLTKIISDLIHFNDTNNVGIDDFDVFPPVTYCHNQEQGPWGLHQTSPSVISFNCSYSASCAPTTDKEVLLKRLQIDIKILDRKYNEKNSQLLLKDATIASLQSEISELKHELILMENECAIHLHDLRLKSAGHIQDEIPNVSSMSREKCERAEEAKMANVELEKYKHEVDKLKEEMQMLDTAAQETRYILTQEIAEKHDTIKSLRHEFAEQTEHHKEIVQQLVLKCEVIKGLRKDLKQVEQTVESRELELAKRKEELNIQQQLLETQATEIENQKITIANLQQALVQSKRGVNSSSNNAHNHVSNGSSSAIKKTSNNNNNNDVIDV